MLDRQQKIRTLKAQLNKLEAEEQKAHKLEAYGRVIMRLSELALSKRERSFLLSCVEDRIASAQIEDADLEFVGALKKKLSGQ